MQAPLSNKRGTPAVLGLLAMLFVAACSGNSLNQPDPYNGAVDPSSIDGGVAVSTDKTLCNKKTPCYPAQQAYLRGQSFFFYNVGAIRSTALPDPITPSVAKLVDYSFQGSCATAPTDPRLDAYVRDRQFDVFTGLPVSTLPLMTLGTVTNVSGDTCNDIKTADSIGTASSPGAFGAQGSTMSTVAVRAVVDATVPLGTGGRLSVNPQSAWYRGLQLFFVDGGNVPTDANGRLLAMDGVILDPPAPPGQSFFAKPTDPQAVILQFGPGDPGYSPIVRLYDFTYKIDQPLGTFTGICHGNDPNSNCRGSDVDIDALKAQAKGKLPFNTIFIVASPQ